MLGTVIILIFLLLAAVRRFRLNRPVANPFAKANMHSIKGLAAIIVVMVHILPEYQNSLQDAIGSFAYIAVTIFFFASAYGMEYSFKNNPNYLKTFWRNRLTALLVPAILCNVLFVIYRYVTGSHHPLLAIIDINLYVWILLQYCLLFYLVHILARFFKWTDTVVLAILSSIVTLSSLWNYLLVVRDNAFGDWPYERMGLVWGMMAYHFRHRIVASLSKEFFLEATLAVISSLVLGVLYLKFKDNVFWGAYLLKVFLGIALISTVFLFTSKFNVVNGVTTWLGNISYPLYLSHTAIMWLVALYYPHLESGVFIIAIYGLTLLVSDIEYRISVPLISRLKKR